MKSFLLIISTFMVFYGCQAQYKNTGIKTRYPAQSSDNLILGNATEHHESSYYGQSQQQYEIHHHQQQQQQNNYDRYNGNFKPAEYYQGGPLPTVTRAPVVLDATAEFINKTRAGMASGVCYKEVPTASLLANQSANIPAGNGTSPGMSKILVCCDGYKRNPHIFKKCDPICEDDCPNGICTAPNTCVCLPGHKRNEDGLCVNACASEDCESNCENCENGQCTEQGLCSCNTGFANVGGICKPVCNVTASLLRNNPVGMVPQGNGTNPDMSKIQVCCDGYERNPHVYKRCDPICADDCPNGICTAPNTCVCIPGHVRNEAGKCITTCPIGCGNGVCGDNNECRCKPGYTLEPLEQKYCVPLCEPACQFGKCVAPNKCACQEGYRLTASGACEPHCENCENGKCTAPGFCSCNAGYIKVGGVCEPVCALGCDKGFCIAPDTCSCNQGFELDRSGTKCIPHCDVPCLNGVCGGNNQCTCNDGYVQDEAQPNMCKPDCPHGCPNGYCTAPNFCVCKPGYIKTGIKGRQSCTFAPRI